MTDFRTARDKLRGDAQYKVHKAVVAGKLAHLSTLKCADCGAQATCYDHRDYHKPLDVVPVCKGCNNRRGPGLPLPEKTDGQSTKTFWIDGFAGKNYAILEAGEGFIPLSSKLNGITHNDIEVAIDRMDFEFATRTMQNIIRQRDQLKHRMVHNFGSKRGFSMLADYNRTNYFKERDPWFVPFF